MSLSRALDKYLKTVSVHKKGHQQSFTGAMLSSDIPLPFGIWTK
uniref:Shufflon-specific DNA recombinase n=1 Tax=Klebsiella pneumoniae TaxID=573 RepID=A0A6M4NPI0_KLEPN|nr:Shufflon-specific DNA recombinase [Klebsiella pneumoniae]